MANLTIRNVPDFIVDQIRTLSTIERRSMNSEILVLLEHAVRSYQGSPEQPARLRLSTDTQSDIWERLGGTWIDDRSTEEIIEDIYSSRTTGRSVDL
ncbi:MAG: FitA-like ribbon-helix-helix domain-containing protein [Spirochaetota bacterium]